MVAVTAIVRSRWAPPKKGIAECAQTHINSHTDHANVSGSFVTTTARHFPYLPEKAPILHSSDEIELGKQKSSTERFLCATNPFNLDAMWTVYTSWFMCVCVFVAARFHVYFIQSSFVFFGSLFFLSMEFEIAIRNKNTKGRTNMVLTAIDMKKQFSNQPDRFVW